MSGTEVNDECPECGHSINRHVWAGCCAITTSADEWPKVMCKCTLKASDVFDKIMDEALPQVAAVRALAIEAASAAHDPFARECVEIGAPRETLHDGPCPACQAMSALLDTDPNYGSAADGRPNLDAPAAQPDAGVRERVLGLADEYEAALAESEPVYVERLAVEQIIRDLRAAVTPTATEREDQP